MFCRSNSEIFQSLFACRTPPDPVPLQTLPKPWFRCTRVAVQSMTERQNHTCRESCRHTPLLQIVRRPEVLGSKCCRCHSIRSEQTPLDLLSLLQWREKLLQ